MTQPIRVLHILHGLNVGGAEAFLKNLRCAFDDKELEMDFLLRSPVNDENTIRFFEERGSKIFYVPLFPQEAMKNIRKTKEFFKKHASDYDVIHVHANSLFYYEPIKVALKYTTDVKVVVHSHNTSTQSRLVQMIHYVNRIRLSKDSVVRIACSQPAGEWMFGQLPYKTVNNGINLNTFRNSEAMRGGYRKKYQICSEQLICVGRLEEMKNQKFLIPVVRELVRKRPNLKLVICGEGTLRRSLEENIKENNLTNNIYLLGNRNDVAELLKASDLYLMPSIYEGLGIAAIEAQATGIPCIISNQIPKETILCENTRVLPLEVSAWVWAIEEILDEKQFCFDNFKVVDEAGFGLETLKKQMLFAYGRESIFI